MMMGHFPIRPINVVNVHLLLLSPLCSLVNDMFRVRLIGRAPSHTDAPLDAVDKGVELRILRVVVLSVGVAEPVADCHRVDVLFLTSTFGVKATADGPQPGGEDFDGGPPTTSVSPSTRTRAPLTP